MPHGGSANGEVDLNPDGTIGKGIAQKQDPLPVAIASAVGTVGGAVLGAPLNTILAHFLAPAATAQGENGEKVTGVDFTITPIKRIYVVKVTKSVAVANAPDGTDPCGPPTWDRLAATFDTQARCRVEVSISVQRAEGKPRDDLPKSANPLGCAVPAGRPDAG
jgi:hypothetical protein